MNGYGWRGRLSKSSKGAEMENARPQTTETSATDKRDYNPVIADLVDSIRASIMAGKIVAATD